MTCCPGCARRRRLGESKRIAWDQEGWRKLERDLIAVRGNSGVEDLSLSRGNSGVSINLNFFGIRGNQIFSMKLVSFPTWGRAGCFSEHFSCCLGTQGAAPLQTKQAERVLERIYLIQIYCCYFIK